MYISNHLCARVFTISVHRASSVGEMISHRPRTSSRGLGMLGPPTPGLHSGQGDGRRSMTITPYKKRKRMLLGGIPRDQFDNAEKSRDFAMELLPDERELLLSELHKLHSKQQEEEDRASVKPTKVQLRLVSLSHAIPFIGFGFLDNAIMIMAGDYIDLKIGTVLGISTMAAAGFGNLISDLAGLGLAGYVETLAVKLGVPMPQLTAEQLDMASTRWAAFSGRSLGIVIGCLLGMFPLLFLETRHEEGTYKLEPGDD